MNHHIGICLSFQLCARCEGRLRKVSDSFLICDHEAFRMCLVRNDRWPGSGCLPGFFLRDLRLWFLVYLS